MMQGGLDSNVVMLLEANIDQAGKAGAAPAVKVPPPVPARCIITCVAPVAPC